MTYVKCNESGCIKNDGDGFCTEDILEFLRCEIIEITNMPDEDNTVVLFCKNSKFKKEEGLY